jgi:hypothetical protein
MSLCFRSRDLVDSELIRFRTKAYQLTPFSLFAMVGPLGTGASSAADEQPNSRIGLSGYVCAIDLSRGLKTEPGK